MLGFEVLSPAMNECAANFMLRTAGKINGGVSTVFVAEGISVSFIDLMGGMKQAILRDENGKPLAMATLEPKDYTTDAWRVPGQ